MAALAVFAELTIVRVLGSVAVHAGGGDLRARHGPSMTLVAGQKPVLAIEHKAGLLRVVIGPALPTSGDMARRAVRSFSEAPIVACVRMAGLAGDALR